MKKRIALLIALSVMLTATLTFGGFQIQNVAALPTFQRVDFVSAQVTSAGLNVRQATSTSSKVVCTLKQGQIVKVFGKIGDWYAIYEPGMGCVGVASAKYLKPVNTAAPAPAPAPSGAAKPAPAATSKPAPAGGTTPAPGVSTEEQTLLNLVNNARRGAGLHNLVFDMELMKVARLKAKDMVDKNYFSHQSPTYGSPFDMMKKFGISFQTAGENIAGNQTVEAAFKAWMNSPGHKANILNANYNYCGFGIVPGSSYGKIMVQMFIGR